MAKSPQARKLSQKQQHDRRPAPNAAEFARFISMAPGVKPRSADDPRATSLFAECITRGAFPPTVAEQDNATIVCTSHPQIPFIVQAANRIVSAAPRGRAGACFPFDLYDEDGTHRRENITDWALDLFRRHYNEPALSKWSIFDYVYGVLHHPGYRKKFADNLRRELPRIPLAPDFRAFQRGGQRLLNLHHNYEKQPEYPLEFVQTPGVPLSFRVEGKMRLTKDKTRLTVNPSLTLAGIPPEAFDYRLGNRSAFEWVIDQFQVRIDKRSGTTFDPNRPDDERYIVRLIGQVITVSIETVKVVNSLPKEFAEI